MAAGIFGAFKLATMPPDEFIALAQACCSLGSILLYIPLFFENLV